MARLRTATGQGALLHQRGQRHRSPFLGGTHGSWCLALILAACWVGLGQGGGVLGNHTPPSCWPDLSGSRLWHGTREWAGRAQYRVLHSMGVGRTWRAADEAGSSHWACLRLVLAGLVPRSHISTTGWAAGVWELLPESSAQRRAGCV